MKFPTIDAVVLLLFLVPGFLAIQLYRAKYPAKRITQLEIVIWSILHSFVIHWLLSGAAVLFESEELDMLRHSSDSVIDPGTIAVLLAGGLVWGLALILFHWCRVRVPFLPNPDPQALWPVAAEGIEGQQLWALVRTKQDYLYMGWIQQYSFDPTAEDHEVLLRPAYFVNEKLEVQRDLGTGGVYLNTRDVESVELIPGR